MSQPHQVVVAAEVVRPRGVGRTCHNVLWTRPTGPEQEKRKGPKVWENTPLECNIHPRRLTWMMHKFACCMFQKHRMKFTVFLMGKSLMFLETRHFHAMHHVVEDFNWTVVRRSWDWQSPGMHSPKHFRKMILNSGHHTKWLNDSFQIHFFGIPTWGVFFHFRVEFRRKFHL